MPSEEYMKIETMLTLTTMGLFLMLVWVAMQIIKSKTHYVYQLQLLVKGNKKI